MQKSTSATTTTTTTTRRMLPHAVQNNAARELGRARDRWILYETAAGVKLRKSISLSLSLPIASLKHLPDGVLGPRLRFDEVATPFSANVSHPIAHHGTLHTHHTPYDTRPTTMVRWVGTGARGGINGWLVNKFGFCFKKIIRGVGRAYTPTRHHW